MACLISLHNYVRQFPLNCRFFDSFFRIFMTSTKRNAVFSLFLDWIQYIVASVLRQGKVPSVLSNYYLRNNGKPDQSSTFRAIQLEKGRHTCAKLGYFCMGKRLNTANKAVIIVYIERKFL